MIDIEKAPYHAAAEVGFTGARGDGDRHTRETIWHERHGEYAAVVAIEEPHSHSGQPFLYLLLASRDGEWVPVQHASDSRWTAYDEGALKGVLMDISHSAAKATQRVRVKCGANQREVEVRGGHVCVVLWDVDKLDRHSPLEFLECDVADQWVPCVVRSLPMTAQQFGEAYLSDDEWGWYQVREADSAEDRLKLIMAVIQQARLPQDERALGGLGAGPLEDMMSAWLLDELQTYLPFAAQLKFALGQVRMEFVPDVLQERLRLMLLTTAG